MLSLLPVELAATNEQNHATIDNMQQLMNWFRHGFVLPVFETGRKITKRARKFDKDVDATEQDETEEENSYKDDSNTSDDDDVPLYILKVEIY